MRQLESAKRGLVTPEMKKVGRKEGLDPRIILKAIARGEIVLPFNIRHRPKRPCAIGAGTTTKVNANIGTSSDYCRLQNELKKLKAAIAARADCVMDLSTGGDIARIRREILKRCPLPLGTVPIYETASKSKRKKGAVHKMDEGDILQTIEQQAQDGVDFFTLHCGITRESLLRLSRDKRIGDIVSRGGAILAQWITRNKKENPLYQHFNKILDIARRYEVTLSLGDGMRPGAIADASDRTQIQELILLGELAQRAKENNVQVMIEGPGHVPLDQIQANVLLEKRLCRGAPFYVLGPLVTDVALGYDHITAAIGGALAASYGADFLCYVTRSEHLRLPTIDDVYEGVIACRIAAHAGDLVKGVKNARAWDDKLSAARKRRDWPQQLKLALDQRQAKKMRRDSPPNKDACSMCSQFCSLKIMDSLKKNGSR